MENLIGVSKLNYVLKFQYLLTDFRVLVGPYSKFVNPRGRRAITHLENVPPLKAKLGEQALVL